MSPPKKTAAPLNLDGVSANDLLEALKLVQQRKAVQTRDPARFKAWRKEHEGEKAVCTHCGESVVDDFGPRTVRDYITRQPWCKPCRATEKYRNKPRVYRSKHNAS